MCTLYYKHGGEEYRIGCFRDQIKAVTFWEAIRPSLEAKFGKDIKPIFVTTGKGRGKNG